MTTTASSPQSTNQSAVVGDAVVVNLANLAITSAKTLLFSDFPFLATPGLKQLVELLLSFLSKYFIKAMSQLVTFEIIDSQVKGEITHFDAAMQKLKDAQLTGNLNDINDALFHVQVAAQNLGHSDGSGPLH
jgi:hypothetical protein